MTPNEPPPPPFANQPQPSPLDDPPISWFGFLMFGVGLIALAIGGWWLWGMTKARPENARPDEFRVAGEYAKILQQRSLLESEFDDLASIMRSPDPLARRRALSVLSSAAKRDEIERQRVVAISATALKDDDSQVRCQAMLNLGNLDAREQVMLIEPFLVDGTNEEKIRARATLRQLGADLQELARRLKVKIPEPTDDEQP